MSEAAVKSESLKVRVVTPEGALFEGEAGFVAAPGADGEVGVLPSHTPLIARLGIGILRVVQGGPGSDDAESFGVRGGFLQVLSDEVTLLVTEAVKPEDLDADALAEELTEILAALQHPADDEEFAALLNRRLWVETRQKLL